MPARRRKLQRLPRAQLTPEIAFAFEQIKVLEKQCSCADVHDECRACSEWFHAMTTIPNALKTPPNFWPVLPQPGPGRASSRAARALYQQLDAALTGT
jgi:hypothetical protein